VTAVPTRVGPQPEDVDADALGLEARITQVVRGAARAAVLGVNDGLVSNVCLILAVAGADASRSSVRLPASPV
jgi:vacuolar iron transporter family protein